MTIKYYVEFKLPDSDKMTLSFRSKLSLNQFLNDKSEKCEIVNTYEESIRASEIKPLMNKVGVFYPRALKNSAKRYVK